MVNLLKQKSLSLPLVLILVVLSSCGTEDPEPVDLGYTYFPNKVGTFIEYAVDSTHYTDDVEENFSFFIREEYIEEFTDNEGQLSLRIDRYQRFGEFNPWLFQTTYVQKRTSTTAERVEDTVRFVRMVFPVNAEREWDGNVYNTLDPWNYSYSFIGEQHIVGPGHIYEDCVRVEQRDVFNLIDQEEAWEIYSRGLGLVHKRLMDLSYATLQLNGVDMEMKIIDSGDL